MANRFSIYSNLSGRPPSHYSARPATNHQLSTTSLLNDLHNAFRSAQPHILEPTTTLAVNTWATATVDRELAARAWEHARRRAEDACVLLGSLHPSTPSLLVPFVEALPFAVPVSVYTALTALRPFLHQVTPQTPARARYSALAAVFNLSIEGDVVGASLNLSTSGIDVSQGLVNLPSESGYRAFDVFYFLLAGATASEREYLELKAADEYTFLKKSGTYAAPSYMPTADDAAAAEDWRTALGEIGIKGADFRGLICVLAAVLRLGDALDLMLDQEELEDICEQVAGLMDIDTEVLLQKCSSDEREALVAGVYECLVDWVLGKANAAIRAEIRNANPVGSSGSNSDDGIDTPSQSTLDDSITASLTIVDVPSPTLAKALAMTATFDRNSGINNEMGEDGLQIPAAGSAVTREMEDAQTRCEAELEATSGPLARERDFILDKQRRALEIIAEDAEGDCFLKQVITPVSGSGVVLGWHGRFSLKALVQSSRLWFHLCLHPTDDPPANIHPDSNPWSASTMSNQIRSWRLPEWGNFRNKKLDYTVDFDVDEFAERYSRLGCQGGREGVEAWIIERGWSNGEVMIGHERVWVREAIWWGAESMLDMKPMDDSTRMSRGPFADPPVYDQTYHDETPAEQAGGMLTRAFTEQSREHLLGQSGKMAGARSSVAPASRYDFGGGGGDYGLGHKGDDKYARFAYEGEVDPELADGREIIVQPTTFGRRAWVWASWLATFWMPSFMLTYVGRMKRPDVRQAWREKVLLIILIFLLNAAVIFYIVGFGNLLCPGWNKAWNEEEVGYHQGEDDYWVSHAGKVYDLTSFWRLQHSDTSIKTTSDMMEPFGGQDMSGYIRPPLFQACPGLVDSELLTLTPNTTLEYPQGEHVSGEQLQADTTSALHSDTWYSDNFLPRMEEYYKGDLVVSRSKVKREGSTENHYWFMIDENIYDLTDYFYTLELQNNLALYNFLGDDIADMVRQKPGQDLSDDFSSGLNRTMRANAMNCLNNRFYVGRTDFRESAKCQVTNYMLLSFTIVLVAVILVKFLAALQLGSKKRPAQQDKFVICQVPAYTEGEESLRKGLDSLTALSYDNKRKLICVVCDGMIVGGGNDRPTPKIVLDILGVDPKMDPPALPFKSVGQGSEQLNYGKVYSGLYEFEGNVVPYLVVVKVGKESEQNKSKPGNRGKRDSQILLMSFLNRVHHRSPMNALELEMFHQINNIIGVDPELYEYLFMVDADTKVKEDSLNRLVAACANDAKIAGICGETSLENEERSWWTMIQVYEYFISHHLAKAFESLFGSVTCLPGCFCMYRLRTADKGRPLIISDSVIAEYSDNNVDTLHKKNLLALGEDRYLTTLMTKHFPSMSYKFIPNAYAQTEAPSTWSVLLSQRRRWINSTVHNLAELVRLKDLCGFCCFSMRFVVFIDLFGTIILPATCVYLAYLIYRVASGTGQFPLISIIMIAAVYGLQAIIFILKRQWQHIGWMIIYLLAFPIYSFVLPVYSFWQMDNFSWGSTRVVIGEKGNKKVVATDDPGFDPRSIPLQRWDDHAAANGLPGRRGMTVVERERAEAKYGGEGGYEMDEMQSTYSSVMPASTILTGFPQHNQIYRTPQSPGQFGPTHRHSTYSRFSESPAMGPSDPFRSHSRLASVGNLSDAGQTLGLMHSRGASRENLSQHHLPPSRMASPAAAASPGEGHHSAPHNQEAIVQAIREGLAEVDLETVTKKQLKEMVVRKLAAGGVDLDVLALAWMDDRIDVELAGM